MVFSTIEFLFQFLPIFLLAYYATPQKYRNITLIIGSLVFYAIGSGWYTLLLLLSLVINYGLSRLISGSHARHPQQAKRYLIGGLVYNFGLLVVFKYTNFLIGNLNSLLSVFHVAIPSPCQTCRCRWASAFSRSRSHPISLTYTKTRHVRREVCWIWAFICVCSPS